LGSSINVPNLAAIGRRRKARALSLAVPGHGLSGKRRTLVLLCLAAGAQVLI